MAKFLTFPEQRPPDRPSLQAKGSGEVVAMNHIDLHTVVEAVRVLRLMGRDGYLDRFNGKGHRDAMRARQTPAVSASK